MIGSSTLRAEAANNGTALVRAVLATHRLHVLATCQHLYDPLTPNLPYHHYISILTWSATIVANLV
jgi:hypothetical protein